MERLMGTLIKHLFIRNTLKQSLSLAVCVRWIILNKRTDVMIHDGVSFTTHPIPYTTHPILLRVTLTTITQFTIYTSPMAATLPPSFPQGRPGPTNLN